MRIARYIKPIAIALGLFTSTFAISAELSPVFTVTSGANWGATGAGNGDLITIFSGSPSGTGSFIQRFDGFGNRLQSSDWYVSIDGSLMSIGASKRGDYGIAWRAPDGNNVSVYARTFTRTGATKVTTFKVNTSTQPIVYGSFSGMNDVGDTVVFWSTSPGTVGANARLLARVFSSTGTPVTGEIEVSAASPNNGAPQGVLVDKNGNFTCIWMGQVGGDVMTRRFSRNGTPLTNMITANTYLPDGQAGMHIAMNPSGQSVIAWESHGQDGDGMGIYAQRFNAAGQKVGAEIHVSEATIGDQKDSSVGIADDGSFAIAWIDDNRRNAPSSQPSVMVRQYGANGTPLRSADVVATPSSGAQANYTSLGMSPDGTFLVTWRVATPGSTAFTMLGRRYAMDTSPYAQAMYSGVPISGLSGATGSMRYFKLNVPNGATQLTVSMAGGTSGDADFYVRLGNIPSSTGVDVSSTKVGNTEAVQITGIPAGVWYVGVYGYAAYSGVSLTMTAN